MDTQPLLNGLPGSPWHFLGILIGLSNCPKNLSTPSHMHTTVILPLLPTPNPGLCCLTPLLTASTKTPIISFCPQTQAPTQLRGFQAPPSAKTECSLIYKTMPRTTGTEEQVIWYQIFLGTGWDLGYVCPPPRHTSFFLTSLRESNQGHLYVHIHPWALSKEIL